MDLKGIGYTVSTLSVVLLAIVAWPKPQDPDWHMWLVVGGSLASVAGMAIRFVSHRREEIDVRRSAHHIPPAH